jgi:signal transduction histidine kinase
LLWSRSQQDKLEVNLQSNSIDDLLEASIKPLMETAKAKNVRLLVNKNNGHQVYCDSFMIKTVIRNLVSNAIKFTSADKEVKINCSQSGDKVFVSVEDDGVGMDKDTVDNLLKVDNPKSQKGTSGEEGTGLGLILCKDFVEKNNGKMEIESEVNKGTKITFHLPVQA